MTRGIDSETAATLRGQGWTLGDLQASSDSELRDLGFSSAVIANLRAGDRPAIPTEALVQVLYANRWTCCVCRGHAPVVVHHITAWAKTHDHSLPNLAVLCPLHHGEAHTVRELELSLTAPRLRQMKLKWEAEVARMDAEAIQKRTQLQSDTWLYFNHFRLLELATQNGVVLKDIPGYERALREGVVDVEGMAIKSAAANSFMYIDSDRMALYGYMKEALHGLLAIATVRNISDELDRGTLKSLVLTGDLLYVQGTHSFVDLEGSPLPARAVRGSRSANKVEVVFDFDRREATSMSAYTGWLSGRRNVGSLVHVKEIERVGDKFRVIGTVISMRTPLEELKTRTYEDGLYKSGLIGNRWDAGDEEDDED